MSRIVASHVALQTTAQSVPATPAWFGEMTVIAHHLTRQGVLAAIAEQVHYARRRFGHYDVIDFLAVLVGYVISGERTLDGFFAWLFCCSPLFAPALAGTATLHERSIQLYVAFALQISGPPFKISLRIPWARPQRDGREQSQLTPRPRRHLR